MLLMLILCLMRGFCDRKSSEASVGGACSRLCLRTRAENGPKFFGPARPGPSSSGPGPARPVRTTTKTGPARPGPSFLRPGPARPVPGRNISVTFPKMFVHRFLLVYFYRNICFSGYFCCITYVFIVLSMFRETFWKFS
jgi:hypothetical protein